jgi:hypothetical protein
MGKQEGAQERFINNVSAHISGASEEWIRKEAYGKHLSCALFMHVSIKGY